MYYGWLTSAQIPYLSRVENGSFVTISPKEVFSTEMCSLDKIKKIKLLYPSQKCGELQKIAILAENKPLLAIFYIFWTAYRMELVDPSF